MSPNAELKDIEKALKHAERMLDHIRKEIEHGRGKTDPRYKGKMTKIYNDILKLKREALRRRAEIYRLLKNAKTIGKITGAGKWVLRRTPQGLVLVWIAYDWEKRVKEYKRSHGIMEYPEAFTEEEHEEFERQKKHDPPLPASEPNIVMPTRRKCVFRFIGKFDGRCHYEGLGLDSNPGGEVTRQPDSDGCCRPKWYVDYCPNQ